jgi:hypothetical protein
MTPIIGITTARSYFRFPQTSKGAQDEGTAGVPAVEVGK